VFSVSAFQNCSNAGSMALERGSLGSSSLGSFDKLIGACPSGTGGVLQMCDERWGANLSAQAQLAASCGPAFITTACPLDTSLLGHCELVAGGFLRKIFYYQGFSNHSNDAIPEATQAESACNGMPGTWIGPGP
jgi:hypothetical protein